MTDTLIHYKKESRSFPNGVDVWLPEGAIVVDAEIRSGAWIVSFLVPSGRTSRR